MRPILTLLVLAGIALAVPAAASASPIRECGSFYLENIENLTTRNVSTCREAREFAIYYQRHGQIYKGRYGWSGWRVVLDRTHRMHGYYSEDLRFSNGWQVIRYQSIIDD